ncbi:MAG TPA: amidohydrolase family protein [Blastocatellia bacterium]|nr:amidohydrolase family protein [Blastocatellia bacterium]
MKRVFAVLALLALSPVAVAQAKIEPTPAPLVFTHVTVIDATGAQAKADMSVVIIGDRIAEIGPTKKLRAPKNAQVIDASGKFLIPGLWDMHVHAFDKGLFSPLFIANGITGVRDMFSPLPAINQWRKEIKDGTIIGPHIVAAGPIVDGPKPIWPGSIAVSNADEGIKAVNTVKQDGSDFVKVYSLLPRDAYFAIAAEAKRQGMVFAGHVPGSVTPAEASNAGQKSIEHLTGILQACSSKEAEIRKETEAASKSGQRLPFSAAIKYQLAAVDTFDDKKAAELYARFVKNGTWMAPTLTVLRAIAYVGDSDFRNDPRLSYVPGYLKSGMWGADPFGLKSRSADDNSAAKRVFQKSLEMVGAMRRAGVQIIAGTDTPNPFVFPGFSLHDELGLLVKAGLTPMEALQAATRNAAVYLGKFDAVGTIEKGKLSDLVLLDADPLADIANTKKINAVVVGGKLISRAGLDEMLSKVEERNKVK